MTTDVFALSLVLFLKYTILFDNFIPNMKLVKRNIVHHHCWLVVTCGHFSHRLLGGKGSCMMPLMSLFNEKLLLFLLLYFREFHCAKKPVTRMLIYPWKCTVLHCNPSARAIIKVSGHQHQWFPGVSQVVTM